MTFTRITGNLVSGKHQYQRSLALLFQLVELRVNSLMVVQFSHHHHSIDGPIPAFEFT
jgi:hypothetical protein